MDRNSPTSVSRVRTTLETQRKAGELRAAGASFREIGRTLGIDHTWARALVLRALDHAQYESADLMRTQEGERLDRLQRAVWAKAMDPRHPHQIAAIREVRRLMERRARLFGLDHSDAIAERTLALAETQGQLLADGMVRLLDKLGLGNDPAARAAAAEMLADLGRRELEGDILDVEVIEEGEEDHG